MKGCLSLPFRLAALALLAIGAWVAWENRDNVRRWVHRVTADAPSRASDAGADPTELRERASRRLDSLERGRVDSVVLSAGELAALVNGDVGRRTVGAFDSVTVELGDGTVTVAARLDPSRLPAGTLGGLAEFVAGGDPVEATGSVGLRRLGVGEWRLGSVRVRGVPWPRALWSQLVDRVAPGEDGSVTFDLPAWVTGLRVSRSGAVLYGRRAER
jgi:hypothetical protein